MFWWLLACGGPSGTPTDTSPNPTGDDDDDDDDDDDHTGSTEAVTWYRDVWPVAQRRCMQCHVTGGIAPFAFDDPETVEVLGGGMASAVQARTMPPWSMQPECREVPDSAWLDDEEIDVFVAWADAGSPLGDPADAVPWTPPTPPDPGPADAVLEPSGPYHVSNANADDYRCFPLGHVLDEEIWLRGVEVSPSNLAVAHHVILHLAPPDQLTTLQALDAADPAPGYECIGFTGLDNDATIGGWVPGRGPLFQPDGVGQRLAKGSQLVLQVHYNTLGVTGDPGEDLTSVKLWTLDQAPPEVMVAYPVVHFGLEVPPHTIDTVSANQRIAASGRITRSAPHMHGRGRAMHTQILRDSGGDQCLSLVDPYDFDWQYIYDSPAAAEMPIGIDDVVRVSCTFDNSDNDETLVWGEGYEQEMCLDYVGVVMPWQGGTDGGNCSGYPVCDGSCAPNDPLCSLQCLTQSGDSCLFCGLAGMLGPCLASSCGPLGTAFQQCMASCNPGDDFENTVDCLYERCKTSFDAYWACAKPKVESGVCASSFTGCPQIAKP